jgi:hypothetical protein
VDAARGDAEGAFEGAPEGRLRAVAETVRHRGERLGGGVQMGRGAGGVRRASRTGRDRRARGLDGRNEKVGDGVQQALGREPRDFTAFCRAAAATGVWSW